MSERGISIVDCLVNVNPGGQGLDLGYIPKDAFRDEESRGHWPTTAMLSYLFSGATGNRLTESGDPARVIELLEAAGIGRAVVVVEMERAPEKIDAMLQAGDRFVFSVRANPHEGLAATRRLAELAAQYPQIRACSLAPHGLLPTIPPNSKEYYPLYAKCVELGLAIYINVGMPGPRVPGWTQDPIHLDEVCWFFPELTIVMKHGGEPWVDMCIKLMLKWPNLYYATSGFAPKYYPQAIMDYANTRGADRILYAGYWPILSFEDSLHQLASLPLRDHVWSKFLRDNACRVFNLS